MNLLSLYYKLRMWGVRGVVNHFLNQLRRRKFHRFFADNARRFPCPKPQRGLTLIAEFSSQGSLHKTMRDFAFSLKDAGIPFQTYDFPL